MHSIKKLDVGLKLSAGLSKKTAMEGVRNYYEDFFKNAIERAVCSFPEDKDLIIDNIEIDLGPISPSDVPATLEKRLVDEISRRMRYSESSPQMRTNAMEKAFFKYLVSGYADMSILGNLYSSKELCALIFRDIIESHDAMGQLVSVMKESMSAFFRFIDIVGDEDLIRFIEQMWPERCQLPGFEGMPDFIRLVSMALVYLEPDIFVPIMTGGTSSGNAVHFLGQEHVIETAGGVVSAATVILERLRNDYSTHLSSTRTVSLLHELLSQSKAMEPVNHSSSPSSSPSSTSSLSTTSSMLSIEVRAEDYPLTIDKASFLEERIELDDAGLVLLAPFFKQLFSRLQYLDERSEFLSPVLQSRAVHILRYIATGTLEGQMEENLVLEKALCGLPFDFPSGVEFKMNPKEHEEVENLCSTVLKYWNPFKEKTINSLRQAFIMRHGTIERDEVSWIVRVEGQGLDILMDGIQWGYSTVSLPWAGLFIIDWQ